ncbi:3796_t:CDS:2, partial [Acaulospora morrowiae]
MQLPQSSPQYCQRPPSTRIYIRIFGALQDPQNKEMKKKKSMHSSQGRTNPILTMHARKNTIRTNSTDSNSFTSTKTFLGVVFSLGLWRDLWRYLCEPLIDVNRFR